MNAKGARAKAGRRPAPKRPGLRLVPAPRRRRRLLPFLIASSVLMGPIVFGVVTVQALVSQSLDWKECALGRELFDNLQSTLLLRIAVHALGIGQNVGVEREPHEGIR